LFRVKESYAGARRIILGLHLAEGHIITGKSFPKINGDGWSDPGFLCVAMDGEPVEGLRDNGNWEHASVLAFRPFSCFYNKYRGPSEHLLWRVLFAHHQYRAS
jgi:hypothetical protein